jgi:hypothetical protein
MNYFTTHNDIIMDYLEDLADQTSFDGTLDNCKVCGEPMLPPSNQQNGDVCINCATGYEKWAKGQTSE